MLILNSTSDLIRVVTSAAGTVDVHASWVDKATTGITAGRTNTVNISTATTTTVVASPASGVERTVKFMAIRNRHASTANTITVLHSDGTNIPEIIRVTLAAGDQLQYTDDKGFEVVDSQGRTRINTSNNGSGAATNALNIGVLASDVTNNNATANTIADITGLSFSMTAGETYYFKFTIHWTSAATTTGARFSVNGPASPTMLRFHSRYSLTATTETLNQGLSAYDTPAGANATPAATGSNIAIVEGFITPSANGDLIARFASEVSSSAVIARAGSFVEWVRVL